uniref:response regulator n=1 Tax=Roseivirga sp. TaxID=1964215 RepID=UPI004047B9BE
MLRKKNILVVDDELLIHQLLQYCLAPKYEVFSSSNGKEALDFLRSDIAIDLMITDLEMPIMSGSELLNEISTEGLNKVKPPVIMISGNDQFDAATYIQSKQIQAFMHKPFQPDVLTNRVEQILEMA